MTLEGSAGGLFGTFNGGSPSYMTVRLKGISLENISVSTTSSKAQNGAGGLIGAMNNENKSIVAEDIYIQGSLSISGSDSSSLLKGVGELIGYFDNIEYQMKNIVIDTKITANSNVRAAGFFGYVGTKGIKQTSMISNGFFTGSFNSSGRKGPFAPGVHGGAFPMGRSIDLYAANITGSTGNTYNGSHIILRLQSLPNQTWWETNLSSIASNPLWTWDSTRQTYVIQ